MLTNKTILIILLLIAGGQFGACQEGKNQGASLAKKAEIVKAINITIGINKKQAISMIDLYRDYVIKAHCMPTQVQDDGDCWYCIPNVGDDCEPDSRRIQVDKKTGAISWGNGPSFSSPKAFASEVTRNPGGMPKPKRH